MLLVIASVVSLDSKSEAAVLEKVCYGFLAYQCASQRVTVLYKVFL